MKLDQKHLRETLEDHFQKNLVSQQFPLC